jgi:hypothetical protein
MRDWSLKAGDPLSLTIAADARLCKTDYVNDHIWELEFGTGEPAALAIRTNYGLRARNVRLFYRFGELGKTVTHPAEFHTPLLLRRFYPNFLSLTFSPFEDLDVTAEYWIPESHALAGRLVVANRTDFARRLDVELCGALIPLDGQSFALTQQQMVNVLAGQTGGLAPVLFMTGGPHPGPGPYPSLTVDLALNPRSANALTWTLASEAATESSFEAARHIAARRWDAERTRIELLDAGNTLDIQTGDADWDAALAFSQKAALGLFYSGNEYLPNPSFVQSRQPDGGNSRRGNGHDYPPSWSGQTPLDSYYLASLLPAAPGLIRGLVENFLSVQTESGFIDGRPGLGGQRAKHLAAPLIASLAWNYYQNTQDEEFIKEAFPKLQAFFWNWFSPDHDTDRDGIPSWDHVLQTGFEDHPIFDTWHPWSQGVNISALHNPQLESMLYREAGALISMAERLHRNDDAKLLQAQADILRASVEASWDSRTALYAYCDRATKQTSSGKVIARHKGDGNMRPRFESETPVRLLIEIQTKSPAAKRPVVEIAEMVSRNAGGESEVIERFQWRGGGLVATSEKVFSKIGRVSVKGLEEKDKFVLRVVDTTLEDITLFVPLWARIPDEQRAQLLIGRSLLDADRFDRPFGVPALPFVPDREADTVANSVYLHWNHLIGEGLLAYGFRNEAARLVVHLMNAVIENLKQNRAFYARYHADTGSGIGERGALTGLAPVGLFLQTLGVTIYSPKRVRLEGRNPFAWSVTIQHKGLKVVRGHNQTEISFPNGKMAAVTDAAPLIVSAE